MLIEIPLRDELVLDLGLPKSVNIHIARSVVLEVLHLLLLYETLMTRYRILSLVTILRRVARLIKDLC